MTLFVLVGVLAVGAKGETVDSGEGRGAGWSVVVPDVVTVNLVPEAVASVPSPCPPAPQPCSEQASNQLAGASVAGTVASASLLRSEANAAKEGGVLATLQTVIDAAATPAIPSAWNTRGYARAEGLSLLNGAITATSVESESLTAKVGDDMVRATGVRVVNLQLAGTFALYSLAPIVADQPNQVLLDNDAVRIVHWETNWNPLTGTTPNDEAPWVNALRVIDKVTGADFKIAQTQARSTYTAPPPPPDDDPPPPPDEEDPPANLPPVAQNDTGTTQINDPVVVNVTANDSDPEGNLIQTSVTVTQQAANGNAQCTNNLCTYTPNANFVGTDTFTYRVCDNTGQCATAVVTITVTNAPPVADDDTATTPQGSAVTIAVTGNDSDPDGNLVPSSATVTQQPANGVVICSNGSCTYTPNAAFSGTDTFEYRVCDSKNLCDTAIVTVTVQAGPGGGGGNLPPVAGNDTASTNVGTSVGVNVLTNDSDPDGTIDPTSVAVISGPANGSVICSNGTCTYTPQATFSGIDSFVYRVCDDDSACTTATVTITVSGAAPAGANQPPVAVDDSRSTDHNTAVTLNVLNNDSDADGNLAPNASVVLQPANGSVVCNGGSCTYTPQTGFSGTDFFDYRVCDTDNACDTARVTITVAAAPGGGGPVNQPPVANDDTSNTSAGTPVTIDVTPNDSDPDNNLSDTVTVINHPDNGAVICDQGECTYTPAPGFAGTDSFDYRICDTTNACDTATVTITVAPAPNNPPAPPANSPPVAANDSVSTSGGSVTISVLPNDSDPDGNLDGSTVAVTQQPQNGAVVCSNGSCTYTPNPGYTGTDTFEYRVCDTQNACDTALVTVTVTASTGTPDNSPPVAEDDSATARPGRPVTIDVVDNDGDLDGDLDATSVTVTVPPANGSVICLNGKCTYTPEPGYTGTDEFEYRVCDALGACTTATVTITISAPNSSIDPGDGGGGNGGGNNGGGNGGGNDGPDRNEDPAGPDRDDDPALPATPPNAPISLDSPLLGAPNAPLPFTGGEPSFYLGAAFNLLLIGMLLLLIERFTRSSRKPCPAWHNHEEANEGHGCAYGEWS